MKCIRLSETRKFDSEKFKPILLHESPYIRILNYNLLAGQVYPIHRNPVNGQVTIQVMEGKGFFLGEENTALPAEAGDILVCDINEPHGVRAETALRILITIAPPF